MAANRSEQGAFGWVEGGQGGGAAPAVVRRSSRAHAVPAAKATIPVREVAAERLPPDDELWDVHAAARFLKRSVSWVYHKAEDGTLPVRRLAGWGLRFIPGELRAWVESGGVAPARHRE